MQKDTTSADDGFSSSASPPSQDQRFQSPPPQYESIIGFTTNASFSNSDSLSPSGCSCDEDRSEMATENGLYLARLTLEYDQLVDRYRLRYNHLQEALKETEALRQENTQLRMANRELANRLSLLTQVSFQNRFIPSSFPSPSIINDFRRLFPDDNVHSTRVSSELLEASPTSVIENNPFERRNSERISLPKSISVRGHLKMNQTNGSNGTSSRTSRLRVSCPVPNEMQRVPGNYGQKEEKALELEVFNQGMLKTELCNKWQESGTCPYGDNCQFAHGISELRPVIRHPRYKTEVCRMVLTGDKCPYGHRCHFRHALTEQEKFIGSA